VDTLPVNMRNRDGAAKIGASHEVNPLLPLLTHGQGVADGHDVGGARFPRFFAPI